MSEYRFRINEDEDRSNVIVVTPDNKVVHADDRNKNFGEILRRLREEDFGDDFLSLFSLEQEIRIAFEGVEDKVEINNGNVYFDDEPIAEVLGKHIVRSIEDGTMDHRYLVAFWSNIKDNPSAESREALMSWLEAGDFTITLDGLIVGYKGLTANFGSISRGPGIVNGVAVEGSLDNSIGNVVSIDREYVDANRDAHCSRGLHVGTWEYASGFAQGAIVSVHVNPRDVVSVPRDHNGQKMRVCEYTVVRQVTNQYGKSVLVDDDWS